MEKPDIVIIPGNGGSHNFTNSIKKMVTIKSVN